MSRGEKSKDTHKQERKADHIVEGNEKRGVVEKEAERCARATVNKDDGGCTKQGGSGRGGYMGHATAHTGRRQGRSLLSVLLAKKAAAPRKRNVTHP